MEDAGLIFRRALLNAGSGVVLLGFMSRLPRIGCVTLALPKTQLLCLKNGL